MFLVDFCVRGEEGWKEISAQQCYLGLNNVIHRRFTFLHIFMLRKNLRMGSWNSPSSSPGFTPRKMSVRRHFAPNFRLWTSIQLCKNQTSNGNRATMSCIFCEEVLGLTFPEQTPCCIIHVLLVISAISISFLLLLYLCISSSSNDQMMRSTVFLNYY